MKKRSLFIILLIVLVALPCVFASAATRTYFVHGTSWLRLRQLPSTSSTILASYRRDFALSSYTKYNADWAYVRFTDGHEGYVMRKYLKSSKSFTAYITTNKTILRTGPAKTFAQITKMQRGTKVTCLTSGANWNYIKLKDGTYGYVNKNYLTTQYIAPPGPTASPAPTFEPTPTPTAFAAYDAFITSANGRSVNIRSGAGTGYAVIASLAVGTEVRVVDQINATWSRIRFDGNQFGYVQSKYLTTSNPYPTTTNAWILASEGTKVNVRTGPGSSYAVSFRLYAGTKVKAYSDSTASWVHIKYSDYEGYVQAKYITYSNPHIEGGGLVTTPAPTSDFPFDAYITSENGADVNVRTGPGTGYSLAGSLPVGHPITVIGKSGKWYHIRSDYGVALTGYVKMDFVTQTYTTPLPTTTPDGAPTGNTMTVVTENGEPVNMRSGPGTGYSIVTRVPNGDTVTVLRVEGNWARVYYNGLYGYIMTKFLV